MSKNLFNSLGIKIVPLLVVLVGCSQTQEPKQLADRGSMSIQGGQEAGPEQEKYGIDFSKVAFVEPASGVTPEARQKIQGVFPLQPLYPQPSPVPFHASDDGSRFANLKSALLGDKKYVWAVRGGYGSARLFNQLQGMEKPQTSKILIGYSDITFLHLLFNQWGWKSIHGAMPIDLSHEKISNKNFELIAEILAKQKGQVSYTGLRPLNAAARAAVEVKGEVLGGNLTLLCNSLGTKWQIQGKDKILLIEDAGSRGYVTDRNLNHLNEVGVFKEARAILFGEFTGADDLNQYAMQRLADSLNIPVFSASIFGHGEHNYPVPFGFVSTISKDKNNFKITIPYDFETPQPKP